MPKSRKQTRRSYDVDDLVQLAGVMKSFGSGGNGHASTGDPSTNVRSEMELRSSYEKEIRDKDAHWQQRFDSERQRANDAKADKEAGRVDSKFEQLQTQALALVQTVAAAAKANQESVSAAAQQQTEAMNQMRDIMTQLGTTVTSLVAAGGSERLTRGEIGAETRYTTRSRIQNSQWIIATAIFAGIAILDLLSQHITVR
jgi:hypothetical protein